MSFYYVCFTAILMLQLGTRQTVVVRLAAIGVALFLIAGFRAEGVDHDYEGYIEYYNDVLYRDFVNVEPAFIWLTQLVTNLGDNSLYLFVIYAALGVALKVVGIYRLTRFPLAAMLIYYSGFFLLWEMTQIRAAVAGGILLVSIRHIKERNLGWFLVLCLLAAMFHYSALVFLPLYFLKSDRINVLLYCSLIPAATALNVAGLNLVEVASFAPVQLIELKINSYSAYADADVNRTFNAVYLARCALAFLLLVNHRFLSKRNEYFPLLIKVYFVALFLHVALASIPGIASRLSELLLVVEVILIPTLFDFFHKDRILGHGVVTAAGLIFLTFSLHSAQLMAPYRVAASIFQ